MKPAACIAIVGCSDQSFKELVWDTVGSIQSSIPNWIAFLVNWWCELPTNREDYDAWCEYMKENPDSKRWWFGQTFLYYSDALEQTESEEFLNLECPVLVISGSNDLECPSTDELMQRVDTDQQDVTYIKIEGMKHQATDPKWGVLEKVLDFLQKKLELAST